MQRTISVTGVIVLILAGIGLKVMLTPTGTIAGTHEMGDAVSCRPLKKILGVDELIHDHKDGNCRQNYHNNPISERPFLFHVCHHIECPIFPDATEVMFFGGVLSPVPLKAGWPSLKEKPRRLK